MLFNVFNRHPGLPRHGSMGKVELEASDSLFSWKSFKNPWKTFSLRVTSADMDVFAAVAKGRESAAKSGHDEFLVSHTFVQVGTSGHDFGVLIVFR